jgi:hypothetical protein
MRSRFGVDGTECEGIFFTESSILRASQIKRLKVEISLQNSNLLEVKRRLARQAKSVGATAITNFRYGQKSHTWWELLLNFKWDTESWYGEGDAVRF